VALPKGLGKRSYEAWIGDTCQVVSPRQTPSLGDRCGYPLVLGNADVVSWPEHQGQKAVGAGPQPASLGISLQEIEEEESLPGLVRHLGVPRHPPEIHHPLSISLQILGAASAGRVLGEILGVPEQRGGRDSVVLADEIDLCLSHTV